jgi:hypothetical protein
VAIAANEADGVLGRFGAFGHGSAH